MLISRQIYIFTRVFLFFNRLSVILQNCYRSRIRPENAQQPGPPVSQSNRITAHHPYHLLPHTLFQVTSQPTLAPKTYILEVLSQNIETEHVN